MPTLKLTSNNAGNPLIVDLSKYLNLQEDKGLDPANPEFSNRVWSRSILREGATLAMEQMTEKATVWPLLINQPSTTALDTLIQQINQAITTPGAIATWQDDGATQATTFDLLSGVLEIQYSYRKAQKFWLAANLRLFSQPLGRTSGPRAYAAASGFGPLLMISPYASSGALAIGASTQAGAAGYGGQQQGASSGIFYPGSPSLAGDAPAQMQISYVGPSPPGTGSPIPYALVSLLPDSGYQPLVPTTEMTVSAPFAGSAQTLTATNVIAGQYLHCTGSYALLTYNPFGANLVPKYPQSYSGLHRHLAVARGVGGSGQIQTQVGDMITQTTSTIVNPGDWQLYDLGTFSLRASQAPATTLSVRVSTPSVGIAYTDVTAVIMVPDNRAWFMNPGGGAYTPYNNVAANAARTLVLDDTLNEQYIYNSQSQAVAPSPTGLTNLVRVTPYTRGLVPRPDPKDGLPIVAIVGMGVGGSTNPLNYGQTAQVNILERTRYVLS